MSNRKTATDTGVGGHSDAAQPQRGGEVVKRHHPLINDEDRRLLPKLGTTLDDPDPFVQVKWFSPFVGWRWYVTEFDGDDTLYGFVQGFAEEWGRFSLSEPGAVMSPLGIPDIERDILFKPGRLSKVKDAWVEPPVS